MAIQINGDSGISGVNGSAGTPALQGTDSNTGIVFGTDTVQISTGGSTRATVDSSGRVGIGTSSPGSYASAADDLVVYNSGSAGITIRSGSSNDGSIYFNDTDDGNQRGIIRYVHGDDALAFHTPSGESMRIDSSGNVGIGTASPSDTLHLNGSTGYGLKITDASSHIGVYRTHSDGAILKTASNHALLFGTNDTERLRIDSSGNVGIGTDSPSTLLDVRGEISVAYNANYGIRFYNQTRNNWSSIGNNIASGSSAANLAFKDSTGEVMRLAGGKLLVGTTTSNAAPLTVAGSVGFGDSRFRAVFGDGYLDADSTNTFGAGNSEVQIQTYSTSRPAFLSLGGPQGTSEGLGAINFFNSGNTDGKRSRALIYAAQEGSNSDQGGRLGFYTATDGGTTPTERMRISQNGTVNTFISDGGYFGIRHGGSSANDFAFFVAKNATSLTNGTGVMYIMEDGDLENANNSYTGISDIKLKENIVNAGSQWSDIKALQVRNYNFKEETNYGTHTQIGLVAQEVEAVSPGLVKERNDVDTEGNNLGTVTKSVNYSVLYMKAVKALQEAMTRIETLEARVTTLEAS